MANNFQSQFGVPQFGAPPQQQKFGAVPQFNTQQQFGAPPQQQFGAVPQFAVAQNPPVNQPQFPGAPVTTQFSEPFTFPPIVPMAPQEPLIGTTGATNLPFSGMGTTTGPVFSAGPSVIQQTQPFSGTGTTGEFVPVLAPIQPVQPSQAPPQPVVTGPSTETIASAPTTQIVPGKISAEELASLRSKALINKEIKFIGIVRSFVTELLTQFNIPNKDLYFSTPTMIKIWVLCFTPQFFDYTNNYELLENFGDTVIKVCLNRFLRTRFSGFSQSDLSEIYNHLSSNKVIGDISRRLKLVEVAERRVGKGKITFGIAADLLEAFMGALDQVSDLVMKIQLENKGITTENVLGLGSVNCQNVISQLFTVYYQVFTQKEETVNGVTRVYYEITDEIRRVMMGPPRSIVDQLFSRFGFTQATLPKAVTNPEPRGGQIATYTLYRQHLDFLRDYPEIYLGNENTVTFTARGSDESLAIANVYETVFDNFLKNNRNFMEIARVKKYEYDKQATIIGKDLTQSEQDTLQQYLKNIDQVLIDEFQFDNWYFDVNKKAMVGISGFVQLIARNDKYPRLTTILTTQNYGDTGSEKLARRQIIIDLGSNPQKIRDLLMENYE